MLLLRVDVEMKNDYIVFNKIWNELLVDVWFVKRWEML